MLSAKAKQSEPMIDAIMLPGCMLENLLSIRTSIQNKNATLNPIDKGERRAMQYVVMVELPKEKIERIAPMG